MRSIPSRRRVPRFVTPEGPAVDEQQRTLVDARELGTEPADADPGEHARVLNDVDTGILLEDVGEVRRHRAREIGRIDYLHFLWRVGDSCLHPASGHHDLVRETTGGQDDPHRWRRSGRRHGHVVSRRHEQRQLHGDGISSRREVVDTETSVAVRGRRVQDPSRHVSDRDARARENRVGLIDYDARQCRTGLRGRRSNRARDEHSRQGHCHPQDMPEENCFHRLPPAVNSYFDAHPNRGEHVQWVSGICRRTNSRGKRTNRASHGQCLRGRGDHQRRQQLAWEGGRRPGFQCTLSVVAESRPQKPLGRSPDSEGTNRVVPIRRPLHLPRLVGRVAIEAARLHLQWRDRAGFAPASLLCPHGHPRRKRDPSTS